MLKCAKDADCAGYGARATAGRFRRQLGGSRYGRVGPAPSAAGLSVLSHPWSPPSSQIKRIIGNGMPISQSNNPRPIATSYLAFRKLTAITSTKLIRSGWLANAPRRRDVKFKISIYWNPRGFQELIIRSYVGGVTSGENYSCPCRGQTHQ
jgi:hypothetical protein